MENCEEINIAPGIKGIVVRAVPDFDSPYHKWNHSDWIILIESVFINDEDIPEIVRFVSYDCEDKHFNISYSPQCWGDISGYKFYVASKKERKLIIDELKRRGLKYVKILNKLIKR